MTIGKVVGISGQLISARTEGAKLYEQAFVGLSHLVGEVIRLHKDIAVIQVYEDTKGIGAGEDVVFTGKPLMVTLAPGILSQMYDGLQRPLRKLKDERGAFIYSGKQVSAVDADKKWVFHPLKKSGSSVSENEAIGYIEEGHFNHYIFSSRSGKITSICQGEITLKDEICVIDEVFSIKAGTLWPVRTPKPFKKKLSLSVPIITGQRCIDFLFPIAKGGTVIFPGGFGTGKTVLEQSIAKYADVDIVVYVGCGERGNEMSELIADFEELKDAWTGKRLMERTILVVNTSNMPVSAREASIYTAVTMAEYYRDMGYNVLLLADSLSRWAEALREISSSLEEMPGEEGYPTYLASRLANFCERAGVVETLSGKAGSLTMLLSVSPPGGDFTEPVTQAALRVAGGFIMLDRELAHRRHFPAINYFKSYTIFEKEAISYFADKFGKEWQSLFINVKQFLKEEEKLREIVEIVGVEGLNDKDRLLIMTAEKIKSEFLCQNAFTKDAFSPPKETLYKIKKIFDFHDNISRKVEEGKTLKEALEDEVV